MALYLESGTIHQDHGSRENICSAAGLMKDTISCSNRENEGGAGSPSSPTSMAAGPFSPAFRPGAPPGLSPLLDPGQLFHGNPTAESILAAQRAGLLGNPLGFPVSLHATLASRPAMFQHGGAQNNGGNTFWRPNPASPTQQPGNNNNNNRVQRKKQQNSTVARKNQANSVKKRGGTTGRKVEVAESTIIEVAAAAMTKITASAPLSPPTSGSSPPSENGSGQKSSTGGEVTTTTTTTMAPTSGVPTAGLIPGRDKVFTCGICHRSFGYKHVLQNHERTHTGEKPFQCEVCEKRFTRDHHLKTHMRLHTGEKPYRCDHCDRTFVQVANLRRHLRVHTGERPYACILCTSKFSDSNQLKAHMLIHKGEKPFCCNRCLGRFRRRHHLMHHKCPGAVIEDENHKVQPQSLPDDFDDEDTTTNDSVVVGSDVSCGVKRETDRTIESTRTISSPLSNIVRTSTMDVGADDLDSLDMEVDEDDEDTNAHYSGRRKNGLILAHNNNGEKKERIRKPQEIRHVIRLQPGTNTPPPIQTSPLAPLPQPPSTHLVLPEQTEPEDLSMSRHRRNGYHSHSSGDSPLSRSPSSGLEEEEEEEQHIRSNIFLQHPKFRRHHAHMQRSNGAPPVS